MCCCCPRVKWNSPTEFLEPQSRTSPLPHLNCCSARTAILCVIDVESSSAIMSERTCENCLQRTVWLLLPPAPPSPTGSDLVVLVTHQLLRTNVQSTWGICTTRAAGVSAVPIPRSHTFPNSHYSALNIIWAYVFKKKKKNKISCINKTYISVISTCAVSRAAPSFRTRACWPTVMEHSDCC